MHANWSATRSIQPQRFGLPVVLEFITGIAKVITSSIQQFCWKKARCQPSYNKLWIYTDHFLILCGAIPNPEQTPADIVLLLVTKEMFRNLHQAYYPCAPSASTFTLLIFIDKIFPVHDLEFLKIQAASKILLPTLKYPHGKLKLSSSRWCFIRSLMYW